VFGDEMTGIPNGKIGYLPEERGLYRKMRLRATRISCAAETISGEGRSPAPLSDGVVDGSVRGG
jgi:hypothetical protein